MYPALEPYLEGRLKVSDLHELHYEESGNKKGDPVIFLHGGPGGGTSPVNRQYFDPEHYRIVLLDQRGAGKSTPHAELTDNTTWDLADIEKLREHLGIEKWHVFGGSWGSTLSLAYSITHPDKVKSICLRGIFLCRPKEIHWFYQEGASRIYPDTWEQYLTPIPEAEQKNLVAAYHKRLTSGDKKEQLRCAKAWSVWEASCSKLVQDGNLMHNFESPEFALQFARIECHYFTNNAFFETDNWLIENIAKVKGIPCEIVHGRYDMVCPVESAWELHHAWPETKLHIMQTSGHSATEVDIAEKLTQIMDGFKTL